MQRKKKKILWIVLILLILAFAAGLATWFVVFKGKNSTEDDFFDPAAVTGILPDMSEAEIQAELDRVVEEGMLNISISSGIAFEDGTSKGLANINNVESNNYIFSVAITLDDSGEKVYESKGIKPGQYIQYIELEKDLEAGKYPATAVFTAYTMDDHKIVGNAAAQLTLYIEQ